MKSKKSQAGMFEIIIVLFVFFLLIGFGLIFYASLQKTSIESSKTQALELRVVRVAQIASSLPELQCSLGNSVRENCFEVEKIIAAQDVINVNPQEYYDLFGYGKIQVEKVYPDTILPNAVLWTLYELEPLKQEYDKTVLQIPVSLYDATVKKNYFGVLNVEIYS